jgi:hypothetical protein
VTAVRKTNHRFGDRPSNEAERWIQRGKREGATKASMYSARLTIDVTPELRARIKHAAIAANTTASELLRELLEREFAAEEPTP